MVGCGGEERKGILFVFFCLYISEMSTQLGFFISSVLMSKTKNALLLSLWSPGSTTGLSVWFMLNIQTIKRKMDAWFFSLHWILAVCNVYWISKTVYLTFFFLTTLVTVVWFFFLKKKRYFASSLAFILKYIFLPATPVFQWHTAWGGRCIGPHFCKLLYTWI